jgi:hypothetical protein
MAGDTVRGVRLARLSTRFPEIAHNRRRRQQQLLNTACLRSLKVLDNSTIDAACDQFVRSAGLSLLSRHVTSRGSIA